jgi:uncharacterized protein (DUF1778 family)
MPRQTATKRQTQSGGRERPTINVRISQPDLDLIDRAAKAHGTNRSVFLIETATARAESVLLDMRLFGLDDEAYDQFLARLDQPPKVDARLRRLLTTPAPWEA